MTVAELRKSLESLPDDMIVAAYTDQANNFYAKAEVEQDPVFNDGKPYLFIEGDLTKGWI